MVPTPGFCATQSLYNSDTSNSHLSNNNSNSAKHDPSAVPEMVTSRPSAICYLPANDLYDTPYASHYYEPTTVAGFPPTGFHPDHGSLTPWHKPSAHQSPYPSSRTHIHHRTDSSSAPSQSSIDTSSSSAVTTTDLFSHPVHMPISRPPDSDGSLNNVSLAASRLFCAAAPAQIDYNQLLPPLVQPISDFHMDTSAVYNSLYHSHKYDENTPVAASNGFGHI